VILRVREERHGLFAIADQTGRQLVQAGLLEMRGIAVDQRHVESIALTQ
jgi:hypothetical protein